jgi:hypothetical protein
VVVGDPLGVEELLPEDDAASRSTEQVAPPVEAFRAV